jgi:hypothetical protein
MTRLAADEAKANREAIAKALRKLGIAMHKYHDDYHRLPQHAIYASEPKPLLSWRVAILPYLGEKELYQQFKLDEPWDSEHNKKLLAKMPAIYEPVGVKTKEQYTTFYQVFVGPGAVFDGQSELTLGKLAVTDGTSNTVMILEAAEAVPWTKPADLAFLPDKELSKLGSLKDEGGSYACLGDCSIVFIRRDIPEKLLRQLVGYNEGGVESYEDYVRRLDDE